MKFKTNINCNGCKNSVRPFLDNTKDLKNWDVDTENENKILTVLSTGIKAHEVIKLIELAGFEAIQISDTNHHSCH